MSGDGTAGSPVLSVVVTTRNDDHGGDLLRRTQIFVDAWLEQARRYGLSSELIVVEWNPPADRPRLAMALRWPRDEGPCHVRIIEVPGSLHRRFRYADRLPLFQMIAKNVGIRRARGQYVLCTNVDVLFSDALMQFFASGQLNPAYLYRVDRLDVPESVPLGVPVAVQLAYCDRHVLRINTRWGTFDAHGRTSLSLPTVLWLRCAQFLGDRLRVAGAAGNPIRLLRSAARRAPRAVRRLLRLLRDVFTAPAHGAKTIATRIAAHGLRWTLIAMSKRLGEALRRGVQTLGTGLAQRFHKSTVFLGALMDLATSMWPRPLHTNACGDFTLLSRERWHMLRGYAEAEMFSLHLDSILCCRAVLAGARELVLGGRMRAYHIEHGAGWSPDEAERLMRRIREVGVPVLDLQAYRAWIKGLQTDNNMAGNGVDWGLASEPLTETDPAALCAAEAAGALLAAAEGER